MTKPYFNSKENKEIQYGISDIKYDIKTGLIRIVKNTSKLDRSDNEITIAHTTTTTLDSDNDDDSGDDSDKDYNTLLTRVETYYLYYLQLRVELAMLLNHLIMIKILD